MVGPVAKDGSTLQYTSTVRSNFKTKVWYASKEYVSVRYD